MIEEIL